MRKCKKQIVVLLILSMLMCIVSPFSVEQVQAAKYKTAIDADGEKIKYLAYSEPDCQGFVGEVTQSLKGGCGEDYLDYWDLNTKQKKITVDIDKTSANDLVKKVHSYGKKGIKNRTTYLIKLKHKKSTNMYKYAQKVKKAPANTYGLTMGIETGTVAANEIVYLEKICDRAYETMFSGMIMYRYKDFIKSKKEIKELDDSSRVYLIADIIMSGSGMYYDSIATDKGMIYGPHKWRRYYSFELIYKGRACGVCSDLAAAWGYVVSKIVSAEDYEKCSILPPNHVAALFKIKRAKGQYDYYEANNTSFNNSLSYPKKYVTNKKMYEEELRYEKKEIQPYILEVMFKFEKDEQEKELKAEEEMARQAAIQEHKAGEKFACSLRCIDSERVQFEVMAREYPCDITSYTFYSVPSSDTTDYQSESELAQKYKAYTTENSQNRYIFAFTTKKEWKRTIYFAFTYAGGERGLIKLDKSSDAEAPAFPCYTIVKYTVIN